MDGLHGSIVPAYERPLVRPAVVVSAGANVHGLRNIAAAEEQRPRELQERFDAQRAAARHS